MDVIVWIILGAIAGAAAVAFWDELKDWANNLAGILLDAIDMAVEVIGGGIVYFIKEGRQFYKALDLYTKVRGDEKYYTRSSAPQQVNKSDIPQGILNQIEQKEKLEVLQVQT
jgi:hypothetical protein